MKMEYNQIKKALDPEITIFFHDTDECSKMLTFHPLTGMFIFFYKDGVEVHEIDANSEGMIAPVDYWNCHFA
ncbi:hypothetical protein [Caulobacter phage Cr30]|uniref:hypothetical protein n=1 Tax=Caulobacter phage Cr30 TaxID=1357714 RepID=UPI0004A9B9C3|nr:hypothetical protein OZ74_gp091 [Caulobacter phage Cr30]AGS80976.1 hypothetical protein [Caulobacter phage Cr30]